MAQQANQKLLSPWQSTEDDTVRNIVETAKETVNKIINIATTPFQIALSKTAWKVYLTTFFFFIASIALLTISSVAYSIFYYNYIPQISLGRVVHLQYGDDAYPVGIVDLPDRVLTTNQAYDVVVNLRLPRTPNNVAAGNFMLDLKLLASSTAPFPSAAATASSGTTGRILSSIHSLTDSQAVVSHARRPAILVQPTYSLLSHLDTLFLRLPWTIFTYPLHWSTRSISTSLLTVESDDLEISMFESLTFGPSSSSTSSTTSGFRTTTDLPSQAHLEIQTLKHVQTPLQIYSVSLHFHARFTGLKYIVYNYRILSFLLFTTIFYVLSLSAMATAYLLLSLLFFLRQPSSSSSSATNTLFQKKTKADLSSTASESHDPTHHGNPLIKSEPPEENTSALEDIPRASSPRIKREEQEEEEVSSTDYDLHSQIPPDNSNFDSGIGTSIPETTSNAVISSSTRIARTTGFSRTDNNTNSSNSGGGTRIGVGIRGGGGGNRINQWLEDSTTPGLVSNPNSNPGPDEPPPRSDRRSQAQNPRQNQNQSQNQRNGTVQHNENGNENENGSESGNEQ